MAMQLSVAVYGTIKSHRPLARKPSAASDAGPVRSLLGGKPHRPLLFGGSFLCFWLCYLAISIELL
jgi:hypothetical protein